MKDLSVKMTIEMREDKAREIVWILNEACSKIEGLKCEVFYRMTDEEGNAYPEDV